jgi:Fic family protein
MLNEMKANFRHFDLKLINPPYGSSLVSLILELENLRKKIIVSETPRPIFTQLKQIFHLLESIGSARIEGNRTTLAEYVEKRIHGDKQKDESFTEIYNNEKALKFIEENIDYRLDRAFISEIHKIITKDLSPPPGGEGSRYPGQYRKINVGIAGSSHIPPDVASIPAYMDELFNFINREDPPQYDLLKVALAHHRFSWIHPFDNGNGRVVRLLTYAMLLKYGFRVQMAGRILNPTAVFCSDREKYYRYLSGADAGNEEGYLNWCEYVLSGLAREINKIDRLLDYSYLRNNILLPAIRFALEREYVTDYEFKILEMAIRKKIIRAKDLEIIFSGKSPSEISRVIRRLKEKKMLMPSKEKARKYVIRFENNYLLRAIIEVLDKEGFLPIPIDK